MRKRVPYVQRHIRYLFYRLEEYKFCLTKKSEFLEKGTLNDFDIVPLWNSSSACLHIMFHITGHTDWNQITRRTKTLL